MCGAEKLRYEVKIMIAISVWIILVSIYNRTRKKFRLTFVELRNTMSACDYNSYVCMPEIKTEKNSA